MCWLSEDHLANLTSKPSSSPPPEGLLWGDGEAGAVRKPQEHASQLKGVFGEGASVVAVPETASAGAVHERAVALQAAERQPDLTPEQLQQRAQSRGLWTDGGATPLAAATPGRAERLPRAVVGTASDTGSGDPANSNYHRPTIGNDETQATASLPQTQASAETPAQTPTPLPAPQSAEPQSAEPTSPAADTEQAQRPPTPVVAAPQEPATTAQPSVQPQPSAAESTIPPTSPAPRSSNKGVLITLIVIAAALALLFIGAAIGLWHLPWGSSAPAETDGPAHSSTDQPGRYAPPTKLSQAHAQRLLVETRPRTHEAGWNAHRRYMRSPTASSK